MHGTGIDLGAGASTVDLSRDQFTYGNNTRYYVRYTVLSHQRRR